MRMSTLAAAIQYLERGDWESAHAIVQNDSSALGCWLHGIVHMMEGDRGNARYWYRRANRSFIDGLVVQNELAEARRTLEQQKSF